MKQTRKIKKARFVDTELKDKKQWHIHYQLTHAANAIGREKDAAAIKKEKPQCAPLSLLEMVF